MEALRASSGEKALEFDLQIEEQTKGQHTLKKMGRISTVPHKVVRLAPTHWRALAKSKLSQSIHDQQKRPKSG